MKCRTCGKDTIGNMNFCYECLNNWSSMRKQIWNYHEEKYGKLSNNNLKIRQKDTKRLEAIWRKDKNKFQEILTKGSD